MGKQKNSPTLDLHGFKLDDVEAAVDKFLHRHSQGTSSIRIMTGKGTGAVRQKVIAYLKAGGFPWSFERLPSGQTNDGVLVVHLD